MVFECRKIHLSYQPKNNEKKNNLKSNNEVFPLKLGCNVYQLFESNTKDYGYDK